MKQNPPLPRTVCRKCCKSQVDRNQATCVHCGARLERVKAIPPAIPIHHSNQIATGGRFCL